MNTSLHGLTIEDVCTELHIRSAMEILNDGWEASEKSLPTSLPSFLTKQSIDEACAALRLSRDMAAEIHAVAQVIASNRYLARLAWHTYWIAYESNAPWGAMHHWPSLQRAIGRSSDLFYAVVSLGALPKAYHAYSRLNIPHEIIEASLSDIPGKIDYAKQRHGDFKLSVAVFDFQRRLFAGEMFQLGRLQFHFNPFRGRLRVFRRGFDGRVLALSEGDIDYRPDGQLFVASRGDRPTGIWRSSIKETNENVQGHPITPQGTVVSSPITLKKSEWTCVLTTGDPVLQIHIPGGTPMAMSACGHSLEQALSFFPTYFPHQSFKGFACVSWLLDDQLGDILPVESNIVRFQRQFYLYPWTGNTPMFLRVAFGREPTDLAHAPRDTSLQRAVLDHVMAGGEFFGGGGFILADDFNWGSSVYRGALHPPLHTK